MRRRQGTAALLLAASLAGCSSAPGSDPIAWWRQLEGGRLAEERPLPPNADAPYPNLGMVPARPAATEAASRARIAAGLEQNQRDAAFAAAQPVLPPAARRAAPAEAAPAGAIGASMAAASAPAASAPAAPAPAPVPQPAPAPAPAPAAAPAAAPAPFVSMPAAPPAPPRLPGVPGATVPVPAPRAPPPAPVVAPFVPGAPVALAFPPGSAILPDGAAATLRALAATRAGRDMRVVGHGEANAADAASQAAVLPLAFARARSIATALAQAGVPPAALRVSAEATGRGGVARIAE
jgi:outer membrane protein OmpA-like peptidoglycan-associated protein